MAGRGDYRLREAKKSKKGARKAAPPVSLVAPPEVEVVKKGKTAKEEREEA